MSGLCTGKFKRIAVFDCRGMEPVDFSIRDNWVAKGFKPPSEEDDDNDEGRETGKVFEDVDLTNKEWADYDDVSDLSVYLADIRHQFVKIK